VFRRQALLTAGIAEAKDAYAVDLFADPRPATVIPPKKMETIRAFHQQIAHMSELDSGNTPQCFKRYLRATNAISNDGQLAPHIEVHRRYRKEWLLLIADARRRHFPWIDPIRTLARAQGATS
jgi:hypothetical protein